MTITLLPVGTIIKLAEKTEITYMIVGYYPMYHGAMWEYSVVLYPGGLSGQHEVAGVNREQIAEVVFEGHLDEEGRGLINKIPDFMQSTSELMGEVVEIAKQIFNEGKGEGHGTEESSGIALELE